MEEENAQCANCDQNFNNFGNHFRANEECLNIHSSIYGLNEVNLALTINKLGILMKKCTYENCSTPASTYVNLKNHIKENNECKLDIKGRNNTHCIEDFFQNAWHARNSNKRKQQAKKIKICDVIQMRDWMLRDIQGILQVVCVMCKSKNSFSRYVAS